MTLATIARRGPRLGLARAPRFGLLIVSVVLLLSVLVPAISPYSALRGAGEPLLPPSSEFWFGTDHLGRDVLVRTFAAAKIDVGMALLGVLVPFLIGTVLGSALGITRNRFARYLGDLSVESVNTFPTLIIVIALVAVFGRGPGGIMIGLWLTSWARYAKVARGRALTLREMDYLEAARCLGYSPLRRLMLHVVPNVYRATLSYAISDFVVVILAIAGLSFLGAGIQPPEPEWGSMMSDGRIYFLRASWPVLFPGALLSVTAIGIALIAEGARKAASYIESSASSVGVAV